MNGRRGAILETPTQSLAVAGVSIRKPAGGLGHDQRPQFSGVTKMIFVASANHPAVRPGHDVNAPCTQGDDEGILHCILVEVQSNPAHRESRGPDSTPSANVSSWARSPSISSGFA